MEQILQKNKKNLSYLTHYKKTTNGIQFKTLMRNILWFK